MASFRQVLTAHSATVFVRATLHAGGFALTGPGVLGSTIVTSPAATQQILASPEFNQLPDPAKAARILEIVLARGG